MPFSGCSALHVLNPNLKENNQQFIILKCYYVLLIFHNEVAWKKFLN